MVLALTGADSACGGLLTMIPGPLIAVIRSFRKGNELSRVTTLMLGGGIGAVLVLAVTPWITRIYGAEQYGRYSLFAVLANLAMQVISLRLEARFPYVSAPESGALAAGMLFVGLAAGILTGAGALAGMYLFPIGNLAWLVLFVPIAAAYQLACACALRTSAATTLATLRSFPMGCFAAFALLNWFPLEVSLILGYVAALVVGKPLDLLGYAFRYSVVHALEAIRRNAAWIRAALPGAALDALSHAAPVIIINAAFSAREAGWYNAVRFAVAGPLLLIQYASNQALTMSLREALERKRSLLMPVARFAMGLAFTVPAIGLSLSVIAIMLGDGLFGLGWNTEPWFILSIMGGMIVRSIFAPLSVVFFAASRPGLSTSFQASMVLVYFVALFPLASQLTFKSLIIWLCALEAILYAVYGSLAFYCARSASPGPSDGKVHVGK